QTLEPEPSLLVGDGTAGGEAVPGASTQPEHLAKREKLGRRKVLVVRARQIEEGRDLVPRQRLPLAVDEATGHRDERPQPHDQRLFLLSGTFLKFAELPVAVQEEEDTLVSRLQSLQAEAGRPQILRGRVTGCQTRDLHAGERLTIRTDDRPGKGAARLE